VCGFVLNVLLLQSFRISPSNAVTDFCLDENDSFI
jgi:hypothetical protein